MSSRPFKHLNVILQGYDSEHANVHLITQPYAVTPRPIHVEPQYLFQTVQDKLTLVEIHVEIQVWRWTDANPRKVEEALEVRISSVCYD